MAFFQAVEQPEGSSPLVFFRDKFGFVPDLFRAQTALPRAIEAEARVTDAILRKGGALSRVQKESILLKVAAHHRNAYCVAAHWHMLRSLGLPEARLAGIVGDHRLAGLAPADQAILAFSLRLCRHPTWIGRADIDALRGAGLGDEHLLETALMTALTDFLCHLSLGVGATPDFPPPPALAEARADGPWDAPPAAGRDVPAGPYLRAAARSPETFAPFAFFRDKFGFIPNLFRAQTLRPDVLEAEANLVGTVLLTEDLLTRVQKESILLVISAQNLNTYCVAVHCEMLRNLGIPEDRSDRIAVDHRRAGLSPDDTALLDFALRLNRSPAAFGAGDIATLRQHGFSEPQILEAVVMIALTRFLNTLQMGLGTTPDFRPSRAFPAESVNLHDARAGLTDRTGRPIRAAVPERDEETELVSRARGGEAQAFGELARRHAGPIYRTLVGITGRPEDAEDAMQEALLRAYQGLRDFKGDSRFATWLTRIAINAGVDRVRARRDHGSLNDLQGDAGEMGDFRPGHLEAWAEDPEQLYSRSEMRVLIEEALLTLPLKYRLAVILRDLQQLSTGETAAAIGVGVPTMKTRLLRGRLMLRDALAPYFAAGRPRGGRHA